MNTPEQPTVLPWHIQTAILLCPRARQRPPYDQIPDDEWLDSVDRTAAIIARHDPHAAQEFRHIEEMKLLEAASHEAVLELMAQHATTVRLLEEELRLNLELQRDSKLGDFQFFVVRQAREIRAHLAALREPATLQPATKEVAK